MSLMKRLEKKEEEKPKSGSPFERLCFAFGCPELGTITTSTSGPADSCTWFCRHHIGKEQHEWPEITRRVRLMRETPKVEKNPYEGWTPEQCQAEIKRIKSRQKDPKGWAKRLKERELRGERLTPLQAQSWREALRETGPVEDEEARLEREAIQAE